MHNFCASIVWLWYGGKDHCDHHADDCVLCSMYAYVNHYECVKETRSSVSLHINYVDNCFYDGPALTPFDIH